MYMWNLGGRMNKTECNKRPANKVFFGRIIQQNKGIGELYSSNYFFVFLLKVRPSYHDQSRKCQRHVGLAITHKLHYRA
jgi:hypothetical protein